MDCVPKCDCQTGITVAPIPWFESASVTAMRFASACTSARACSMVTPGASRANIMKLRVFRSRNIQVPVWVNWPYIVSGIHIS